MQTTEVRRKAQTAALLAFRGLPGPVKRRLVRAGTPSYTIGAVCLLEHEGEVLFLWQPHREGWSLPGGLLDRGESPADAVVREVLEETGLRIDPGDPLGHDVHPDTQVVDVVFRVRVTERPTIDLAHEARKWQWLRPDELPEADRETRQIIDLVSRAGEPAREGRLVTDAG